MEYFFFWVTHLTKKSNDTQRLSYSSAYPQALMFLVHLSEPHQLSFSISQIRQDVTLPPANANTHTNVTAGSQGQRALRELTVLGGLLTPSWVQLF